MADQPDVFGEAKQRLARLLEQLAVAPISDITAVVGANAPGAGHARGDDLWMLSFTCEAWRIGQGEIQKRQLTVRRKVGEKEIKKWQELIRPYQVVRIRARVVVDSAFGSPQALLDAHVGVEASDVELSRFAEQLQEPVTFKDPVLGTFELDRQVDWFTGRVVWADKSIWLNLAGSEDAKQALKTAHTLWNNQSVWNRRIRAYAIEKLLPLKNDAWLNEGEVELTAADFEKRMSLESITVNADGSFDFWHNDGDLFWGHSIQISGSLSEGPNHADIPG